MNAILHSTRRWVWVLALIGAWAGMARAQEGRFEYRDGKWVKVREPAPDSPTGRLIELRRLAEAGKHRAVVRGVRVFLKDHPDSPLREEAMFLLGDAWKARGRYYKAYEAFEEQITSFPDGDLLARALSREYEIADAFLKGRKRRVLGIFFFPAHGEGVEILTGIFGQAPASTLARKAMVRLGDYYFQTDQHTAALDVYDQFLRTYGKSDRAAYVMLQAARCSLESYRGVKYDDTPLLEARQRFAAFAERFPRQARELGIARVRAEIRESLAHHLAYTADYYRRVGRKQAAIYCYRILREQYADTSWAREAREALDRLVDVPSGESTGRDSADGQAPDDGSDSEEGS